MKTNLKEGVETREDFWPASAEQRLQELGIKLPAPPEPFGTYVEAVQTGNLVLWGKYDLSFELSEPEACRRDVPNAQVHVLDAGHFALDTAADEIAALVRGFVGSSG